jgi:hypothetical protein
VLESLRSRPGQVFNGSFFAQMNESQVKRLTRSCLGNSVVGQEGLERTQTLQGENACPVLNVSQEMPRGQVSNDANKENEA